MNDAPHFCGAPATGTGCDGNLSNTKLSVGSASQKNRLLSSCAPWGTEDVIEQAKQLRCMATIVHVFWGPGHPLFDALRAGETDATALVASQDLVERLPALHRRRLLATFTAITWPRPPRGSAR